jgi:thioredoxin 2
MTILVFFWSATCGHSRRMDSLVDHFMRAHRGRLKLAKVDVDARPDLAERFSVEEAPSLVLLQDSVEVARLTGRNTLPAIKHAFEPHLQLQPAESPLELVGS